jgi:hypothetical protein
MNEINLTSKIAEAGVFLSTSGDESVPDCKFEMAPVMYFDEGLMAIPILLDGYLILPRGGPASMVSPKDRSSRSAALERPSVLAITPWK